MFAISRSSRCFWELAARSVPAGAVAPPSAVGPVLPLTYAAFAQVRHRRDRGGKMLRKVRRMQKQQQRRENDEDKRVWNAETPMVSQLIRAGPPPPPSR
mmetsp:Transcript_7441/g.20407  ORF Transcript_7441/g.20407 Transcript_7441/m.20407 type:complete len:99 (+) Transcript_7441:58-354(+)